LSRILTSLLLLQAGYAYVPYSSLESVIEQSKEGYYLALRQTQGTILTDSPHWQPWLLFFLRALQQQVRRLAFKVEREKIALAAMSELAVAILDYARDHGRVTMGNMVQVTGASRLLRVRCVESRGIVPVLKRPLPRLVSRLWYRTMTITLPDDPALATLGEDEIRIDLACGAFAAGHMSRAVAARLAGLDCQAFDEILFARHIPSYDEDTLAEDLETLRSLGSR
jgi:predicted HTH domain antitoxin